MKTCFFCLGSNLVQDLNCKCFNEEEVDDGQQTVFVKTVKNQLITF